MYINKHIYAPFPRAESLSWKTVPPDTQFVLLGSDVSLAWDFELGPNETTSEFFQVMWAQEEFFGWMNLAIKSWQLGTFVFRDREQVKLSENDRATLMLLDVTEDSQGKYRCSIESSVSLAPTTVQTIILSR